MRENVTYECVLFTPCVGCSRLLSSVNDLTTTNQKIVKNSTLSLLMSEHPKQVSLFFETAQCMSSEVIDNLKLMSSTGVRSTATVGYWMKKTTNATFGFDKRELVQVVFSRFTAKTVHICRCFSEV